MVVSLPTRAYALRRHALRTLCVLLGCRTQERAVVRSLAERGNEFTRSPPPTVPASADTAARANPRGLPNMHLRQFLCDTPHRSHPPGNWPACHKPQPLWHLLLILPPRPRFYGLLGRRSIMHFYARIRGLGRNPKCDLLSVRREPSLVGVPRGIGQRLQGVVSQYSRPLACRQNRLGQFASASRESSCGNKSGAWASSAIMAEAPGRTVPAATPRVLVRAYII